MEDFYRKNLELVSRKFPPDIIENAAGEKKFELIKLDQPFHGRAGLDSGLYTAKVTTPQGNKILLHSRVNPLMEAKRFVDSRDFKSHDSVICFGFGLGYIQDYLAKKLNPKIWMAFVESDVLLFKEALKLRDLSGLFSRERLSFYLGRNQHEFLKWMRDFLNLSEAEVMMILSHPASLRKDPAFYLPLEKEVMASINRRAIELNTLVHYRTDLDRNAILNSPIMLRAPGFKSFRNKFSGMPAVIIASGPSLDMEMENLKKIKDKAVIICVSRSYKVIVENGIIPHFVVTLDMTDVTLKFFEGFDYPSKPVLVFDPDSYHEVVEKYRFRKISYLEPTVFSKWLKSYKPDLDELKKGLSVAHMGFYFADYIGCNPLILVGVDLAYPTGKFHASGVAKTGGGDVDMKQDDPNLVYLPSVLDGKNVRSIKTFQSFVSVFEADILGMDKVVINTTPFGARIRGTKEIPFSECVETYCKDELELWADIDAIFEKESSFDEERFKKDLSEKIRHGRKLLSELEDVIKKTRRLRRLDPDNRFDSERFVYLSSKCQSFALKLIGDTIITPFLQRQLSKSALSIKHLNREIMNVDNVKEKRALEVDRIENYLVGYRDALSFFMDSFEQLASKLNSG